MEKVRCSICGSETKLMFHGPNVLCRDCVRVLGDELKNYPAVFAVTIARKLEKHEGMLCRSVLVGADAVTLSFLPEFNALVYYSGEVAVGGDAASLYKFDVETTVSDVISQTVSKWRSDWPTLVGRTPLPNMRDHGIFKGCENMAVRLVEDFMHGLGAVGVTTERKGNSFITRSRKDELVLEWDFSRDTGVRLVTASGKWAQLATTMEAQVMGALFQTVRLDQQGGAVTVRRMSLMG